jgi:hypothetical protein
MCWRKMVRREVEAAMNGIQNLKFEIGGGRGLDLEKWTIWTGWT